MLPIRTGTTQELSRLATVKGTTPSKNRYWTMLGLLAILALSTTGCTGLGEYVHNGFKVGPNYAKPDAKVADQWIDTGNPNVRSDAANDAAWWQNLNDPTLDALIDAAYRQNLSLRAAGMRIMQARAQRGIAVGGLFPQSQAVFGSYDRNNLSANGPVTSPVLNYDDWNVGAGLTWELDFWGYYRRAIESANAKLDVSIENYDYAIVLLLAEVAQRYVDIRTNDQQLEFVRQNVKIQRDSLNLAEVKFANGATTRLDVTQGEFTLAQTEAAIPPLESARREAANQLCILLGIPPRDIADLLNGRQPIPSTSPDIALGVPADLLRRRPDIRAVERDVAAQSAQIGIATAQLYPHFSIAGNIYYDAEQFKDLLSASSFGGGIGPSFTWNILNYGRLVNGIYVQDARFQELVFTYQNKVLQANAEAENALVKFLNYQEQVKDLTRGTKAAEQSVELVLTQYNEGKTDFNRVLTIEQQLTQQQNQLAVAQGAVVQSLVQLYKAIGGGWQIRLSDTASSGEATLDAGDSMPAPAATPAATNADAPVAVPQTPPAP